MNETCDDLVTLTRHIRCLNNQNRFKLKDWNQDPDTSCKWLFLCVYDVTEPQWDLVPNDKLNGKKVTVCLYDKCLTLQV